MWLLHWKAFKALVNNFTSVDFERRYLGCVSSLQTSIWNSDVHGFGNLGLKRGRDFKRGGPMRVQETSAMEVIIDWRTAVSF
ncbi:hypothetical protein TNCV_3439001 [Trichonephila clavipes]|nr:hypothetical protein TNCV_3439001 [Trichonephila clavipes]